MDFTDLLNNIPDYKVFLTVDEMDESSKKLAAEYPDVCSIKEVGKSRKGHPIYCLKIGDGPKNAFMFGCPHPNEPMGAMMLEYFSRYLCEHEDFRKEFGYTWYLIKSIDADGTHLNEGWFKGPFTLYNYAHDFYRPIGSEQAEWTFPFEYKKYKWDTPIPETKILMDIIDETKPEFMYSLHNAGFGGAYWYISDEAKPLYDQFYAAAARVNVPLNLGEPEVPYIPCFAPAVYKNISMSAEYDYMEKYGNGHPEETMFCGDGSSAYAGKYGTFSLVAELPYFYSPKIEDQSELDFTRLEAVEKGLTERLAIMDDMAAYYDQYKEYISPENVFMKITAQSLSTRKQDYDTEINFARQNPENQKKCKVSEAFDNLVITKFYLMLSWSGLIRAAKFERDKRIGTDVEKLLNPIIDEMEEKLKKLAVKVEEETQYSVVPIKKLVSVQLESGMVTADWVKNR